MGLQVKVDAFIEMVSTTAEAYVQLFIDGDLTTFSSDDEAHFVLALCGVITSKYTFSFFRQSCRPLYLDVAT